MRAANGCLSQGEVERAGLGLPPAGVAYLLLALENEKLVERVWSGVFLTLAGWDAARLGR